VLLPPAGEESLRDAEALSNEGRLLTGGHGCDSAGFDLGRMTFRHTYRAFPCPGPDACPQNWQAVPASVAASVQTMVGAGFSSLIAVVPSDGAPIAATSPGRRHGSSHGALDAASWQTRHRATNDAKQHDEADDNGNDPDDPWQYAGYRRRYWKETHQDGEQPRDHEDDRAVDDADDECFEHCSCSRKRKRHLITDPCESGTRCLVCLCEQGGKRRPCHQCSRSDSQE
jgi:hypothetical protein